MRFTKAMPAMIQARGKILILRSVSAARDITVKHDLGNTVLKGSSDCLLGNPARTLTFVYNGANYQEIARSEVLKRDDTAVSYALATDKSEGPGRAPTRLTEQDDYRPRNSWGEALAFNSTFPKSQRPKIYRNAIAAINRQASEGDIAPDEASLIVGLLEAQRKAIETANLAERVASLEQRLATGAGK